jgi:uncharacterized protein YecT (DUF1311 family)
MLSKTSLICCLFFTCLNPAAWAQAEPGQDAHPLDQAFEACVATDGSTAGMHACNEAFRPKWDAELNRYYALLGGDKNAALRRTQVAWIAFRDAEFAWIEAHYGQIYTLSGGGTMWGLLANSSKTDVIRSRVLTLREAYHLRCETQNNCQAEPAWGK